jgi:hypothetical protein
MTHAALIAWQQRQNGQAPAVLPPHGYLLVHGQTTGERARTLGLLRREKGRVEQAGLKCGDLHAAHN